MTLRELESKIRNFLSGRQSDEGQALFDHWYDSFQDKNTTLSHDHKKQIQERIYRNIQNKIEHSGKKNQRPLVARRFYTITQIAAAIALVIAAYLGVQQWSSGQELIYQTAFGETEQLKLPDGTTVSLNANSSLRYHTKNPREVWLEGEGFFEVQKKPRTKAVFLVHTQDLVIEVLGTAFNVNSRHERTQVVLEEGSVKLKLEDGQQEMMEPGDLIAYSKKEDKILERKKEVKTSMHSSWKDGTIIFNEIPLEEALQKVADQYGIQFKFSSDSLKKREVGGGVPMNNLKLSLLTIEKITNAEIEKKDDIFLVIQKEDNQ
jgi:transmembrane sensor